VIFFLEKTSFTIFLCCPAKTAELRSAAVLSANPKYRNLLSDFQLSSFKQ